LFLDEIGEMPTALQAVLLRFLDDWTVRPLRGAEKKVDVRRTYRDRRDPT
jgi:transcriptional regulator of acetoin/glycerol metabolism